MISTRVGPVLGVVALLAASVLGGCGSDDDPAGGQDLSCGSKLARHQELGMAVLLSASPADAGSSARLLGVDVRTGATVADCPLPALWRMPGPGTSNPVPMSQGGVSFPAGPAPDAIIGGQWISPDLRWAAGIDRPLADLRRGVAVQTGVAGEVVAVAGDTGLVRRSGNIASGSGWCTVDLAALLEPDAAFPADCTPLADPGIVGGYLLDPTGTPFWAQSEATRIRLGDTTGYAVTDGSRVLRVELFPASEPRADGAALVSADGRTVLPLLTGYDWFTVTGAAEPVLRTTAHRTGFTSADRPATAFGIDGGAALVLGFADGDRTRFVQLTTGSDAAADLPVGCPAGCRIVTWPDRA